MEIIIPANISHTEKHLVEYKDTAAALGSGAAPVYSTPAMIALMENTALKCLEPHLPKGYSSVGILVNIRHLKATLPGKEVRCEARVTEIDRLKITFRVEVYEDDRLAGQGEHQRFIINEEEFLSRLK